MDATTFKLCVQLIGIMTKVRECFLLQYDELENVEKVRTILQDGTLQSFLKYVSIPVEKSVRFYAVTPPGSFLTETYVYAGPEWDDETKRLLDKTNPEKQAELLNYCGTFIGSDMETSTLSFSILCEYKDLKANLMTFMTLIPEKEKCLAHAQKLVDRFKTVMPRFDFYFKIKVNLSFRYVKNALFSKQDLRDFPDYDDIVSEAINYGYNTGFDLSLIPKEKLTPEKRGMLMLIALMYENDPVATIYKTFTPVSKKVYDRGMKIISNDVDEYMQR